MLRSLVIALLVIALLAGASLAACTSPTETGPGTVREIGFLEPPGAAFAVITAPDTVRVGVPFSAVVYSFGSSSCVRPDGATIDATAARVTVTPYDLVPGNHGSICTADLASRPHAVALLFTSPGIDTIVARGYRSTGTSRRVLANFPRLVVVLP